MPAISRALSISCESPIGAARWMRRRACEVGIDSSDEIPGRRGLAPSAGSSNYDLVSVGVLADDLDRYLVATVEAQCRMLTHDRIIAGAVSGIIRL